MGLINHIKAAFGAKTGKMLLISTHDINATITTKPILADLDAERKNAVIFGTKEGRIIVMRNEKPDWSFSAEEKKSSKKDEVEGLFQSEEFGASIDAQPAIDDINSDGKQEIIFGAENGKVYALSSSGQVVWAAKAQGAVKATPLIVDIDHDNLKEVIFGTSEGKLYCLSRAGKLKWAAKVSSGIEASAEYAIAGNEKHIVFGTNDGTLYSINETGKLNWKLKLNGKITAKPSIGKVLGEEHGDCIAIGDESGAMHLISIEGEELWKFKADGNIPNAACLADINKDGKLEIIFGSCDDNVYALTAEGEKIWSYEADFWFYDTPIAADIDGDGRLEIIAGSYDSKLYVLDAEGQFLINYVPGVSGITQQPGNYSDVLSIPPGKYTGRKVWEYKSEGKIVGSALDRATMRIVVTTSTGRLETLKHKD